MAKKVIRLNESDLHSMIKATVKQLNLLREGYSNREEFIIDTLIIDGEDFLDELPTTSFSSKYEFRDRGLNPILQQYFGTRATDVDLASEFGEDSDEIYIAVDSPNSIFDIECRGGYQTPPSYTLS
jgi:hypothetical protein